MSLLLAPFMLRAALAALGVALAAAPLGAFVVWRRMAYFGDAISHGAMLGVALALAASLPVFWGVLAVTLVLALAVAALAGRGVPVDTLLGVAAHGALALGLVAVSFVPGVRIDLMAYLFGDVLAVGGADLALIWAGAALLLGLVAWRWRALLLSAVDEDLAIASGLSPRRERLTLMLALALLVAFSLKVVGALLVSALLILPAAAARPLARGPGRMVAAAMAIGAASALGGLALAALADSPAAPSIVSLATLAFLLTHGLDSLRRRGDCQRGQ